jgi:pyruvate ferredoxin oxidoreductase delta subunit
MKYPPSTKPQGSLGNKTGDWRTFYPDFLHEKCTACGICDNVCPEGIIAPSGKKNSTGKDYRQCDLNYCKGCGLCAKNCPFKAIEMKREEK